LSSRSDRIRGAALGAALVTALGALEGHVESRAVKPQAQPRADSAQFIAHPDHVAPGGTTLKGARLRNPRGGGREVVAEGARLFVSYNCADCHGADGSGFMAPALDDGRFHFGGTDGEIFQSIFEGRPEGMPAWGSTIDPSQIWALVSYVQSLNGRKDRTTEDFTGETVQRMGH
jgi:cytochrome c oxidase cbb3-type subunit 3